MAVGNVVKKIIIKKKIHIRAHTKLVYIYIKVKGEGQPTRTKIILWIKRRKEKPVRKIAYRVLRIRIDK
jgi:hypothetical protein